MDLSVFSLPFVLVDRRKNLYRVAQKEFLNLTSRTHALAEETIHLRPTKELPLPTFTHFIVVNPTSKFLKHRRRHESSKVKIFAYVANFSYKKINGREHN